MHSPILIPHIHLTSDMPVWALLVVAGFQIATGVLILGGLVWLNWRERKR